MEFKTFVNTRKEYDINLIRTKLCDFISLIDSSKKGAEEGTGVTTNELLRAVKRSGGSQFASRYGLDNEILFADSELISAYEQGRYCIEYLQYRYEFKYYPSNYRLRSFPMVVAVEAASKCNLRCSMCFQKNMDGQNEAQNRGIMSYELYQKFLSELTENKLYSIVFASRGEPLLNPNIDRMIRAAKDLGVLDIKLNTNAVLLTDDVSRRLLASGLDLIVFSVDSVIPESYEQIRGIQLTPVIENIERFINLQNKEFPNSKTKTRVAMVVTNLISHTAKKEIRLAKKFWLNLVDELSIKSENDFVQIYNEVDKEIPRSICSLLWERLYLWYDGKVNPCDIDHLSTLCVGDISHGETISSIWNGQKMNRLRSEHRENRNSLCTVCAKCVGY